MNINNLSVDEKIGQRFIFGVNDNNIEPVIELIKNAYIGGVILYKKNYKNYSDMIKVIRKLKTANKNNKVPLFIALDQENGRVNRMPNDIHNLKNIYDVSKSDKDLIGDYASITNNILNGIGINMNLAPVVDIYNNSNSKALYKRCIYGDEKDIVKLASKYIEVATKNDVVSVIKHFPGHGATKKDSHFFIPYIFDYKEILDKHMYPFNELIKDRCDAVMVGHIIVRKLTGMLPASINNKFLNKYLRNNGYDGLIISDEINMLKRHIIYRNYLVRAIDSPCDIILAKIKTYEDGYKIINKYRQTLIKNIDDVSMLDNYVTRILKIKEKYNVNDDIRDGVRLDLINKEIDKLNSKI